MSFSEKNIDLPVHAINRPAPTRQVSSAQLIGLHSDADSLRTVTPNLTPTVTRHHDDPPPFYSQPPSAAQTKSELGNKQQTTVYESDLEACITQADSDSSNTPDSKLLSGSKGFYTKSGSVVRCAVWPGREALVRERKLAKRQQRCYPLNRLSGKNLLAAKILIALLCIGIALAVGLGISKAVGGGIWTRG